MFLLRCFFRHKYIRTCFFCMGRRKRRNKDIKLAGKPIGYFHAPMVLLPSISHFTIKIPHYNYVFIGRLRPLCLCPFHPKKYVLMYLCLKKHNLENMSLCTYVLKTAAKETCTNVLMSWHTSNKSMSGGF